MLKLSLYTKPIRVMSNLFAKSMARLVGAPTPIIIPISVIKTFWTNSKLSLPEHVINWDFGSSLPFFKVQPISLSKALCLPTSSLKSISSPLELKRPLAWIPPVLLNSDWASRNVSGDWIIISFEIFGSEAWVLFFFIISSASNEDFPVSYTHLTLPTKRIV